jgi:hypothetical protein
MRIDRAMWRLVIGILLALNIYKHFRGAFDSDCRKRPEVGRHEGRRVMGEGESVVAGAANSGNSTATTVVEHTTTVVEHTTRGTLKIAVSASKPVIRAGESFSVFVTIGNPFDVPVTIKSVYSHLPIEIRDLSDDYVFASSKRYEQVPYIGSERPVVVLLVRRISTYLRNLYQSYYLRRLPRVQMAEAFSLDLPPVFGPHALSEEERRQMGISPLTLSPGNSVVLQFLLKTRNWLFFTPFGHRMIIQIQYEVDKVKNYDTFVYELDISASLKATLIGGAVGGFLGAWVRQWNIADSNERSFILTPAISALLSAMTIVAFARKSNVQPLVSVEDFWGGILVGFIVGYTGNVLFESVIASVQSSQ